MSVKLLVLYFILNDNLLRSFIFGVYTLTGWTFVVLFVSDGSFSAQLPRYRWDIWGLLEPQRWQSGR